jgi:hypothetical protein
MAWSDVGDDAYVFSHGGADFIGLTATTVKDNLHINSGSGNDAVGLGPHCDWGSDTGVTAKDGKVITGSGDDALGIAISTFTDDLRLYTGSGHDTIGVTGTAVKDRFYLNSGSGNDLVGIAADWNFDIELPEEIWGMLTCISGEFGLTAKYATIKTRGGNDAAAVADSVIEKYLKVYMSSGDDELGVWQSTVKRKAYFRGGSGNDAIYAHDNYFKRLSVKGFEVKDIT